MGYVGPQNPFKINGLENPFKINGLHHGTGTPGPTLVHRNPYRSTTYTKAFRINHLCPGV